MNYKLLFFFLFSLKISAVQKALALREKEHFVYSENERLAAAQKKHMPVIESGCMFSSLEAYAKLMAVYYKEYTDKKPKEEPSQLWLAIRSFFKGSKKKENSLVV